MTARTNKKIPAWLLALIAAYIVLLATLTLLNLAGADQWWFGALNLYLPQVVWILPGIPLSVLAFRTNRKLACVPLLGVVWVLWSLMDFCWPLNTQKEPSPGSIPIRVMTWNIKYGNQDKLAHMTVKDEMDRNKPDVVLLQDSGRLLGGPLAAYFSKWHVRSYGQYIIASRFPLRELDIQKASYNGEEHICVRTQLLITGTKVTLYNVHLLTPRSGLNSLRIVRKKPWYLPNAVQQLENNVEARMTQGHTLRGYLQKEQGPVIIAGDLNSPDSSQVCKILRAEGFYDAFAEGGKGYGYTYGHFLLQNRVPNLNFSWMRIDHIMTSSHFQTRRCWTGTDEASAHRPVIADLLLNNYYPVTD